MLKMKFIVKCVKTNFVYLLPSFGFSCSENPFLCQHLQITAVVFLFLYSIITPLSSCTFVHCDWLPSYCLDFSSATYSFLLPCFIHFVICWHWLRNTIGSYAVCVIVCARASNYDSNIVCLSMIISFISLCFVSIFDEHFICFSGWTCLLQLFSLFLLTVKKTRGICWILL